MEYVRFDLQYHRRTLMVAMHHMLGLPSLHDTRSQRGQEGIFHKD
ncbi:hypothetical protein MtrunA17_Chr3g0080041 [Medicago truncatula]|uniref:Uncharacterized protein n=1 Tax=Medicago truncatula TaxID=3880 RepID=A0A396IKU9_MEDTR|nr:hypothetical protein MtrunA17_Chr3g0080041 [Medicago truncatula]